MNQVYNTTVEYINHKGLSEQLSFVFCAQDILQINNYIRHTFKQMDIKGIKSTVLLSKRDLKSGELLCIGELKECKKIYDTI